MTFSIPAARVLRAALASVVGANTLVAQRPPPLSDFLRLSIGLDAAQIAAVEQGDPIVRVLETENPRDVAMFGVIVTPARREDYVRRVLNFRRWLAVPNRVRFGVFSDPAVASDVQSLVIDARDANEAKRCRPGSCKFKLPAAEMRRVREEVDWTSRDMRAQLSAFAQRRLVVYVNNYRAWGDSALVTYDDRGGVRASDTFAALLDQSPFVFAYAPKLVSYFRLYPFAKLDGASEVIFWSEDAASRLRRTLNVNHLVVYTPPTSPGITLVASKQIYAKHYFEGALDLTSIVDRAEGGSYVAILRRYRFDNLPSGGLLNIKGRVVNSLRDKMIADLKREKAGAEGAPR
jgi:hypothetical protein